MGLFGRKKAPDSELAKALATRGVSGRATVVSMDPTGAQRDGVAKEIEFVLDLEVPGQGTVRTTHRQFMNRFTLHGLAPGEEARVMYDRDNPQSVMVEGHVRFRGGRERDRCRRGGGRQAALSATPRLRRT